jgi:hypothetical protein
VSLDVRDVRTMLVFREYATVVVDARGATRAPRRLELMK